MGRDPDRFVHRGVRGGRFVQLLRALAATVGGVGVVLVLVGEAGNASVVRATAEQTYTDASGDAIAGLDITTVRLSSDGKSLSMKVTLASKNLTGSQAIGAALNTDSNAATGNNQGFDYYWQVNGGGPGTITFYRWTGSWSQVTFASYDGSQIDFGITVSFSLAEIGNPKSFNFYAYTYNGQQTADVAPDNSGTTWSFSVPQVGGGGGGGADRQAPSRPGGLTARSVGSTSVRVSWNASSDNVGVARYKVSRGSKTWQNVNGLALIDRDLKPGTRYTYRVTALDKAGNESAAAVASVVTSALAPVARADRVWTAAGRTKGARPTAGKAFSYATAFRNSRNGRRITGGSVDCRAEIRGGSSDGALLEVDSSGVVLIDGVKAFVCRLSPIPLFLRGQQAVIRVSAIQSGKTIGSSTLIARIR